MHPTAPIGPRDQKPTPTGRIIIEAASGRIPGFVDTGLNLVHVDDVANGHLAALRFGKPGDHYILGGQNVLLAEFLGQIAVMCGRPPPKLRLPRPLLYPCAVAAEVDGACDAARAFPDHRRTAHVEAPDVLQFRESRTRSRLQGETLSRGARGGLGVVSRQWAIAMTPDLPLEPSKTHRGENFPVASMLIAPRHRAVILAYYRFARGADDVADSPSLSPDEKLALLDRFEATLTGRSDAIEAALPLRDALAARNLPPRHALDLLRAFRMDAVKRRYANWAELMDYCAYSAAPVGRFVLDVHGESESTWPASDALCTALQVINHLQDCGADYRNLDRVYVPQDALAAQGLGADALGARKAPRRRCARFCKAWRSRTRRWSTLGGALPAQVRDFRLCLETAVIARLARKLNSLLLARDPLERKGSSDEGRRARLCRASASPTDCGLFVRPRQAAPTPIGGA